MPSRRAQVRNRPPADELTTKLDAAYKAWRVVFPADDIIDMCRFYPLITGNPADDALGEAGRARYAAELAARRTLPKPTSWTATDPDGNDVSVRVDTNACVWLDDVQVSAPFYGHHWKETLRKIALWLATERGLTWDGGF